MNFNYNGYPPSYSLTPPAASQHHSLQNANECNYNYPLSSSQSKSGVVDYISFPGNAYHHQWPVKFKQKATTVTSGSKSTSPYRDTFQMPRFPVSSSPNVGAIYANLNVTPFEDSVTTNRTPIGRTSGVKKKTRTIFTSQQINELEKYFNSQQYITCQERDDLAAKTKLTPNQVKIWFQNRRYKLKTKGSTPPQIASFE